MAGKSKSSSEGNDPVAELTNSGPIPNHIAIIMDGNGRWAKSKGMPRAFGHREGVRSVREIVTACGEIGVKYLTLYAFSTENWKRPIDEVSMLMSLLVSSLHQELKNLEARNVRLITIGDMQKLPKDARHELQEAKRRTASNTGLTLNLALSYSGRWDIARAAARIALDVRKGVMSPEDVDEKTVAAYLSTAGLPEPDLLIRTSGEMRLSNFLMWELAYTEMYITECYWPEFRRAQLAEAIRTFQKRERRFGLVSEQITSSRKKSVKEDRVNVLSSY